MPVDFKSSSKLYLLIPATLLFLKSVTMLNRVFDSVSATNSGMVSVSVPLKFGAYFLTLPFSYFSELFFFIAQETRVAGTDGVFSPGGMSRSEDS